MRLFLILALLTCLSAGSQDTQFYIGQQDTRRIDWQQQQANDFFDHFNVYYRHLFACPEGKGSYSPKTDCNPRGGTLDAKEFKRAREEAKKLFGLRDR